MESTIEARRTLVAEYLARKEKDGDLEEGTLAEKEVRQLEEVSARLQDMPRNEEGHLLFLDEQDRKILIDGKYELAELKKDILFFRQGEKALEEHLAQINPGYMGERNRLLEFLRGRQVDAFFTDRDGTVNNYCGRYRSSVQSGYNAVYLSAFASVIPSKPVILTSAPLKDIGIADISVFSQGLYLLAGSKGREYLWHGGERKTYPISTEEQRRLNALNNDLASLLEREENHIFSLIGSGFQRKFGETAVARQDMHGSVPPAESERFKEEVRQLVERHNGDDNYFRLEDTGKDLEIILALGEEGRHFNKGDGISFLSSVLDLPLKGKDVLICGDTSSDLPMVSRARDEGAKVAAVFVTTDESLAGALREMDVEHTIVSSPDVLVSSLNHSTEEIDSST